MSASEDWVAYLDPDEEILWTGQPPQGFRLSRGDIFLIPFSLAWGGFGVPAGAAIMLKGLMQPSLMSVVLISFGGVFFFLGLHILIGRFFVDRWVRRHTRYAITNRRVYMAKRSLWRRDLKTLALTEATPVTLSLGRRSSISIGVENQATRENSYFKGFGSDGGQLTLEGLEDGQEVYQLVRRVQRGEV